MAEQRSIFEEVSSAQQGRIPPANTRPAPARRGVRYWLMSLFALVVIMIAVGGLTRLTDSGLSITEWAPVTGAIPPLSTQDWHAEFDLYRAIPEYQLQNRGMSLEEFKVIYWWEWGHRQLGRFIGLVWAVGFVWFLARREIPTGWTGRLLLLGALGGLQGAIGWWMVSSGLEGTRLDVASYRLATHLGLAFFILGLIGWYVFLLGRSPAELIQARRAREQGLMRATSVLIPLLFAQIVLGALVAGIDAGRTYTDWPLMAGVFVPPELFELTPIWSNFFENPALVQFNHRMLGYLVLAVGLYVWWISRKSSLIVVRQKFTLLSAVMIAQVVLGIVTVLMIAPWHLAISHQVLAVILLTVTLNARFHAAYPLTQSVRG